MVELPPNLPAKAARMTPDDPLQRLPTDLRYGVELYRDRLRAIFGSQALGLVVYGAAAVGSFDPVRHTLRSVLVLETIELETLRRLAAEGPDFGRNQIAAPLTMTPKYIVASRDTFPLELLEIQQAHCALFGPEYFAPLEFAAADVRLQCERELKVILIGMHQRLLAAAGDAKRLHSTEGMLGESLLRILRGLLWLEGSRRAQPAASVVAAAEKLIGQPLAGIQEVVSHADTAGWSKFCNLYADVQTLANWADLFASKLSDFLRSCVHREKTR